MGDFWGGPWLPRTRGRRLLFIVAALYASVQMFRAVYLAITWETNDLALLQSVFFSIIDGDPLAFPWPPHAYLLLAPILWLPEPMLQVVVFAGNLFLIHFIWRRASSLIGLDAENRAWFLVLFLCWVSVRVSLSHGQLGFLVLAAVLWAWTSPAFAGLGYLISSLKYSLSFPVLLDQLFRRPRVLVPTFAVALLAIGLVLVWTGMPPAEFPSFWLEGISRDTTGFGVDVVSAITQTLGDSAWIQLVVALVWLAAFFVIRKRVANPTILVAVLLAMSLLPVYHRFYDLLVLAPALALLLKSRPLGYAVLMTIVLAGFPEALAQRDYFGMAILEAIDRWYTPILVSAVIGILILIDRERSVVTGFDTGSTPEGVRPSGLG